MSSSIQIRPRRVSLDIGVQIVGRIANLALGVVVTLVLARTLGTHGFGQWSTIFAITQIAANFGELGLNQIALSNAASDPERDGQWLGALLTLRLALALPMVIASIGAVLLLAPTAQATTTGLLVSCVTLVSAPAALGAVFQLRVRNDISMAIMTMNSLVWGAAVLAIAASSGGMVAFGVAFLGAAVLTTAVTAALALRLLPIVLRGNRQLWGPLLHVGLGVGAAGILVTFYVRLDQILILEFVGSRQAGLYAAAYRILDQVQFIPISVMTTLFPLIASAYPAETARVRELLQAAAEYLTLASLPILGFSIVAARPIMMLLFGSAFIGSARALPILMGAFVSISFGYLAGNMVVILRLQRVFLRYAAVGLVLNVALNVVLIPHYGFVAAAWVTLATEVLTMVLSMLSLLRVLEMSLRFGRLAKTLLAALVMAGLTWLTRSIGIGLAGLVAVATISYALAVALLRIISPSELGKVLHGGKQAPIASATVYSLVGLGRPASRAEPLGSSTSEDASDALPLSRPPP